MKVKIAARTMSYTAATGLYNMINDLPSEAIHTATFIEDVDSLFDSCNGRYNYPENGNPLFCCISKKNQTSFILGQYTCQN